MKTKQNNKGGCKKNGKIWDNRPKLENPPIYFHRFGNFTVNLPEIFGKKGVEYAIKTVIYKSLGPPDPIHPHLGRLSQIFPFFLQPPLLFCLVSQIKPVEDFGKLRVL